MLKHIYRVAPSLFLALGLFCHSAFSAEAEIADNSPAAGIEMRAGSSRPELAVIIADAREGKSGSLERFCALVSGATGLGDTAGIAAAASREDRTALDELSRMARLVDDARAHARSVLGTADYGEEVYLNLMEKAIESKLDNEGLVMEAVELILAASREADAVRGLRNRILDQYHMETRGGSAAAGTRLAWNMIRVGSAESDTQIDPGRFAFDKDSASASIVHRGVPLHLAMNQDDVDVGIRADAYGFAFRAGWAVLFQKPLGWIAETAKGLKAAGVDPAVLPDWEVMEGPGGVIALAPEGVATVTGRRKVFFEGRLHDADILPVNAEIARMTGEFRQAAQALHEGVMGDESIPHPLRQALRPILMGAYLPIDERDYFDAEFCRRLIEADYLESHISPLPAGRAAELAAFRAALASMEAGHDEFTLTTRDGRTLTAVARPDFSDGRGSAPERDIDTGETLPRYVWRVESEDETVFFSMLPSRNLYALSLADYYPGRHRQRPAGVPARTEVWHALLGRVASYRDGDAAAEGSGDDWLQAITLDARGRSDYASGPLGWNFPLHVLQRDDQGDPTLLATPDGTVPSPDFTHIADASDRRRAEEEWLDHAAAVLSTPGELGLIYHQFFRYCSDSPLPEMPNLIGSHYGLSDTHQTVHQSLERRWVGRLIGDCDDLAEFFQVLTARQGRLSHVMQLPAHAAAGYAERIDGGYRFVVLQTGPVLQFTAATLDGAVEKAYRHFDDDGGRSRFTAAAVPLLLRFADEETRTPFVLSSRIYSDRKYAEAMIRVQEYWHLYTFSAGIAEMEAMLKDDRELGSVKELASLYERVGRFADSALLRREELEAVRGDSQATLSTLLDIAQLHIHEKNDAAALAALSEMESLMRTMLADGDREAFVRAMPFRSFWAMLMSRQGDPVRAWELLREDVKLFKRQGRHLPDSLLRTLIDVHDQLDLDRLDNPADSGGSKRRAAMRALSREIEDSLAGGYFRADDSYNTILRRYFNIGRYAVAKVGREQGLALLLQDGPYPEGPKDQTRRGDEPGEEDWRWLRITPQLYLAYAQEMLDRDEYPERYDPATARRLLHGLSRAVEKGAGLGSDVFGADDKIKASLILAFVDSDIEAYRRIMTLVRSRDYASLYDDAAMVFGSYCGLIPMEAFPAWIDAFHEFFEGRQNYFKAVYRAIDKEHFDHALTLARAVPGFFPGDSLLADESVSVQAAVSALRQRRAAEEPAEAKVPAA